MRRERIGAGRLILSWGVGNALLATGLFAFVSHEPEKPIYYSSVALIVTVAAVFGISRRHHRAAVSSEDVPPVARSGGPALAFAAACLAGALGWVFGVWVAYLGLAPMVYCLAALRAERRRKSETLTSRGPAPS